MADEKQKETGWIDWHPAFFEAIRAELAKYRDALDFCSEYQLVAGPLRIDVLIVKKEKDVVIEKNIGRIFRRVNIIEYKSPDISLKVEDFYKVCEYVCGYRAKEKQPEITDMSVSFVVRKHPREMIRHLRDMFGFVFEERYPGIYVVEDSIVPMQIIESKKLPEDENLWLRSMGDDLSFKGLHAVIRRRKAETAIIGDMGAYLHALLEANSTVTGKGVRMLNPDFIEAVESTGLGAKWHEQGLAKGIEQGIKKGIRQGIKKGREEGIEKGIKEGKLEDARAMFLDGLSLERIVRITRIPLERLEKELQTQ